MIEIPGNIWNTDAEYKVVTTNGVVLNSGKLVMGAGIAQQVRDKFPGIDLTLGNFVKKYGNRVFLVRQHHIISFPTKNDWHKPSELTLIKKSLKELIELVDKFNIKSVALTKPGCGNGGLQWRVVKPLLEEYLDDRFAVMV